MSQASKKWIDGFTARVVVGRASPEDFQRMDSHIKAACAEIQAHWTSADERFHRTGLSADDAIPDVIPRRSLRELMIA